MENTLYGLPKEEIRHRRDLLMETIRNYSTRHYDARIMLPEYRKLTDWLNKNGCKIKDRDYCTEGYWKNPLRFDRQSQNKNPVVRVEEGRAIRKYYTVEPKMTKVKTKIPDQAPKQPEKTKLVAKSSYYKIIISWTETSDSQKPFLTKIIKFFEDLGLDQLEKDKWQMSSETVEKQIAYKFEGTDDGFTMLKRSAMVLLDILNENNNFEIAIHGKKIT